MISVLFTVVYAAACSIIIILFSNYRKEDFKQRLEEKATTTLRLLADVKAFDQQLLKIIDSNSINKLYDEKTVIFDNKNHLVYSSLDDTKISWSYKDLQALKLQKVIFKQEGDNEIYGTSSKINDQQYFVVISANDNYGKRKLEYLIYILVISYVGFTILTWVLCFFAVKKLFNPLDKFYDSLTKINANNLNTRLSYAPQNKNEITLIAKEFNLLLERIELAYQKQKDFTAQASHELRTPLARISAQIENFIIQPEEASKLKTVLKNVNQLSELVNSLLILSRLDFIENLDKEQVRIDEVLYQCMDKAHIEYQDLQISFDILEQEITEKMMTINCNVSLLQIVFSNLIKNAYTYSDNKSVEIELYFINEMLHLSFKNTGNTLSNKEMDQLYQPFMRGENAKNTIGIGLGLRMVHRILHFYGFGIQYSSKNAINRFELTFKHN